MSIKIDTYLGCQITQAVGARYVEIMIDPEHSTAGTIKVNHDYWLFTSDFKLFFGILFGLICLTYLNGVVRTEKFQKCIKKKSSEGDDYSKAPDVEKGKAPATAKDDNFQ